VSSASIAARHDERFERPHRPERYQGDEMVGPAHQPFALLRLALQVLAQETAAVRGAVLVEGEALSCGFVRHAFGGPELSVWVRIAGAHLRATVFEGHRVADPRQRGGGRVFLGPQIDHLTNLGCLHPRQREVVTRRETEHATESAFRTGRQEIRRG
jgi:hypothetical protein